MTADIWISARSKRNGEASNYGCCGLSHKVPINLLKNSNYFCTCIPYLLGEVVSSREVALVISKLEARFFQGLAFLCPGLSRSC